MGWCKIGPGALSVWRLDVVGMLFLQCAICGCDTIPANPFRDLKTDLSAVVLREQDRMMIKEMQC